MPNFPLPADDYDLLRVKLKNNSTGDNELVLVTSLGRANIAVTTVDATEQTYDIRLDTIGIGETGLTTWTGTAEYITLRFGDAITGKSTGTGTFEINSIEFINGKDDQTITFGALADKVVGDTDFDLTATASSALTVTYTSSDVAVATVSGATVTIVGAGTTDITASQSGDATFNAAPDVVQALVVTDPALTDQTITFAALGAKTVGDAPFDLTATASSNLAVTYTSSDVAVATVSGATVTIVGAGTADITASQAGDATYNAAPDVVQPLVVNATKQDQTITFDAIEDQIFESGSFTLSASASSDLTVSFEVVAGPAAVAGDVVTFTGMGEVTVKASQEGNDSFNPAVSVDQTFEIVTVTGIDFNSMKEVSFYPNPASNYLQANDNYNTVLILDTQGRTVKKVVDGRKQIDISALKSGNYVIIFQSKEGYNSQKLLKK